MQVVNKFRTPYPIEKKQRVKEFASQIKMSDIYSFKKYQKEKNAIANAIFPGRNEINK
jgi:hypothetical protein